MKTLPFTLLSLLSPNADPTRQHAQERTRMLARRLAAQIGACFEVAADGALSVLPPRDCTDDPFAGDHRVTDWSAALERVRAYAAARDRAMPVCLQALAPRVRAGLNDSLSNDEASTDEALQAQWRQEFGISAEQARATIAFRPLYLANVFYRPFSQTPDNR